MAKYAIDGATMLGIANAIRTKNGETAKIPTTSMAAKILALPLLPSDVAALSVTSFTPSESDAQVQVQHNMGVKPDFYFLYGENVESYIAGDRMTYAIFEFRGLLIGDTTNATYVFTVRRDSNGYTVMDSQFGDYFLDGATAYAITVSPIEDTRWDTSKTYHLIAGKMT